MLVLPEAEPERDCKRERADDQAAAKLVEVVDDAQPVFMPDGPDPRHDETLLAGR